MTLPSPLFNIGDLVHYRQISVHTYSVAQVILSTPIAYAILESATGDLHTAFEYELMSVYSSIAACPIVSGPPGAGQAATTSPRAGNVLLHEMPKKSLPYSDIKFDTMPKRACICGCATTYGKDTSFHSSWCDLYEK